MHIFAEISDCVHSKDEETCDHQRRRRHRRHRHHHHHRQHITHHCCSLCVWIKMTTQLYNQNENKINVQFLSAFVLCKSARLWIKEKKIFCVFSICRYIVKDLMIFECGTQHHWTTSRRRRRRRRRTHRKCLQGTLEIN